MDDIDDFLPSSMPSTKSASPPQHLDTMTDTPPSAPKSTLFQRLSARIQQRDRYLPQSHDEPIPPANGAITTTSYTIKALQKVSQEELDIVRCVALFTARNQQFFRSLYSHQEHNPRFAFIHSSHPHFPFFRHLTEIYSTILSSNNTPPAHLAELATPLAALDAIIPHAQHAHRNKLIELHEALQRHEEEQVISAIDWANFVLVSDPITFSEKERELLPEPQSSMADIERMIHAQDLTQALENHKQQELEEQEEKQNNMHSTLDDVDDYMESAQSAYSTSASYYQRNVMQYEDDDDEPLKVVAADEFSRQQQQQKLSTKSQEDKQLCQMCGEMIPLSEISEHLRMELLSRDIRDQKTSSEARILTDGDDFVRSWERGKQRKEQAIAYGDDTTTSTSTSGGITRAAPSPTDADAASHQVKRTRH